VCAPSGAGIVHERAAVAACRRARPPAVWLRAAAPPPPRPAHTHTPSPLQERQTKPEGQIHFFPVIFNGKQLYDVMIERCGPTQNSGRK
jgi:hypothetical protein